ncbi:BTAD domain-containing putative transcriptional regulator [Streptomyces sp. NPDC019531]|uniref:AfsR/SARP family transcriptional regulator n=1 Tax=Streptomyces sp. NPDC019531 TaxID=3365062 RepID=UPI00384A553C
MTTHLTPLLPVPGRAGERTRPAGKSERGALRFGLLGPVTADRGGTPLNLGPPQRRALLLRLLVAHGRPVSMDLLCEDLWMGRPPAGAVSAVHAHISRLRRELEPRSAGPAPDRVLTAGPTGYALRVPEHALDSVRFERGLERTRDLLNEGRRAVARAELERTLRIWRGPALVDAAEHPFAVREIARLDEIRLTAQELRVMVLLADGEHGPAVAAARELTSQEPLRETGWELLMRALYLAGRPAEAVRQYEEVRRVLLAELGLEPGPNLRELCRAVRQHRTAAVLGPYAESPETDRSPGRPDSAPGPSRTTGTSTSGQGTQGGLHKNSYGLRNVDG